MAGIDVDNAASGNFEESEYQCISLSLNESCLSLIMGSLERARMHR